MATMNETYTLADIWRYPIKGLGGECLSAATIVPGRGIVGDRRWLLAIADTTKLLSGEEQWRPWNFAHTLKKNERLALLRAAVADNKLSIVAQNGDRVEGDMNDANQRRHVESFLRDFLADKSVSLTDCDARPVWDYQNTPLSAVFSAAVADFSTRLNATISVMRFRPNLILDGGESTTERNCFANILQLGAIVKLKSLEGVPRCRATQVNPQTGVRDINVPEYLSRFYGHNEMGIKCAVICGGKIVSGMPAAFVAEH